MVYMYSPCHNFWTIFCCASMRWVIARDYTPTYYLRTIVQVLWHGLDCRTNWECQTQVWCDFLPWSVLFSKISFIIEQTFVQSVVNTTSRLFLSATLTMNRSTHCLFIYDQIITYSSELLTFCIFKADADGENTSPKLPCPWRHSDILQVIQEAFVSVSIFLNSV